MVGFEPTTPKAHGLPTTPFVKETSGGISPFDHLQKKVNNSLPKLSLIL